MDNGRKAIIMGVGIFITILIITTAILILNIGNKAATDVSDQLLKVSKSVQDEMKIYDTMTIGAEDAISLINKYNDTSLIVIKASDGFYRNGGVWALTNTKTNIKQAGNHYYRVVPLTSDSFLMNTYGSFSFFTFNPLPIIDKINRKGSYTVYLVKENNEVYGLCFIPV